MNDDLELEQMLKARACIEDGAFTAKVMGALPPRRRGSRGLILGGALVAAAVVLVAGPVREVLLAGKFSWSGLAVVLMAALVFAATSVSVVLREAE